MIHDHELAEVDSIGVDDDRLPVVATGRLAQRLAGLWVQVEGAGGLDPDRAEETVGHALAVGAVTVEVVRPLRLGIGRDRQAVRDCVALVGGAVWVVPHGAAGILGGVGETVDVQSGSTVCELVREVDDQALTHVGADNQGLDGILAQSMGHPVGQRRILIRANLRDALI